MSGVRLRRVHVTRYDEIEPFVTVDGSTIREWAGPHFTPARHQSLAEATLAPSQATIAHYHREAEELYLFTSGTGRVRVGEEERDVAAGDCVVIPPGTVHKLWATGAEPLVLVCSCSPPYSDDDTVLVEQPANG
jgi:mannose-6-phosphate isomerase-like protein (cupin superfamily)